MENIDRDGVLATSDGDQFQERFKVKLHSTEIGALSSLKAGIVVLLE